MSGFFQHVDLPETTCGFGEDHALDAPDVRVMRSGAGHFILACTCSEESLSQVTEPEYPSQHRVGTLSESAGPEEPTRRHIGSLSTATEPRHRTEQHIGFINGKWPTSEQWLALDDLTDGWYDERPHVPVDDPEHVGTPAQLRSGMREKIEDLADTQDSNKSGGADREDEKARQVPCPSCGAGVGRKCQRPGGHRVRKSHVDRKDAAREAGILESEQEEPETPGEQASIGQWSA